MPRRPDGEQQRKRRGAAIRGSNTEVIKRVRFEWSEVTPKHFWSLMTDIAEPVLGGANGVAVQVVERDRPPTERTTMGRPPIEPYGEIELEGVLIIGTEEVELSFSSREYPDLPLDLGDLPESRGLRESLATLAAS